MIFTSYSKFPKKTKPKIFESSETKEQKNYSFRLKNGEVFKQITKFEEIETGDSKKGISHIRYGAWFVSNNDAIFLTPEDISAFIELDNTFGEH